MTIRFQMKMAIKIFLLLIAVFGNVRCVGMGVAVFGNHEETYINPGIHTQKGGLDPQGLPAPEIKPDDLLNYWGTPDKKREEDSGSRYWRYNFGLRWNGAGFFVVILPIPLLVPVGHDYIEFRIENDWVVGAKTVEGSPTTVIGCIYSPIQHAKPGGECDFETDESLKFPPRRFLGSETTYKIRLVNSMEKQASIIFTRRDDKNKLVEERFTLEPGRSRRLLSAGFGEELILATPEGEKIVHKPVHEGFDKRFDKNYSLFYMIKNNRIIPVPVEYWESPERDFIKYTQEPVAK